MRVTKWMERRCSNLSKRFGISENVIVARCEKEYRKRQSKHRNFILEWKSFFVGCRVVIKVTPYRKFRQKDRAIHRHFNWATILWHKFNGLELQVNEYLTKKKEKAKARKVVKRKRKNSVTKSPAKEHPLVILDGDSDVELIEERPVINLESDDDEEGSKSAELSFPKIVSVASAGTVVDTIFNVVTAPDAVEGHKDTEMEINDELKPTNEELERARAIFSSLAEEDGEETSKDDIHSALYSLDDSFGESDGNKSNSRGDRTFLDSLADKLGVETDNRAKQTRNERAIQDCYQELEQTFLKVNQVASKLDNVVKDEDTSSSSEFYGFNEHDTQTPGLLPTPVVRQAGSNSAFVSKKCDKLMEMIGPINVDKIAKNKPKKRLVAEEGRINRHSQPPKLECPELPSDMKPRTLAEKKQLLRLKPVGYQVMDQENSVYQLLKKRLKDPPNDSLFEQANRIIRQPVPMRRNVWKTATWLNTRQDHYIYRYIEYQGNEIKLFGCVGNFRKKFVASGLNFKLPPKNLTPSRKMPCCSISGFPKNIKFNNILREIKDKELGIEEIPEKSEEVPETSSSQPVSPIKRKWNLIESRKIPPGPLCTKVKNVEKSDNLAPLDTYILPRIFLQVSPKINQQFPLKVKRYLNEMCPYDKLTDKWIRLALSTLKDAPKVQEPIEFEIPYENDRRKILVSREQGAGRRRDRTTEVFNDDEPLTFKQNLPEDKLTEECAGILEEMINSVAIGMSEDDFSKCDPDLDYSQRESRKRGMSSGKDDCPSFKKPRSSNSLLMELKRLNATIINTENITRQKECNQEHCKMGCLCDSISSLSYPIGHCEKVKCMFECVCKKGLVINNSGVNPFSKEVFRMRDKAISRLAQAEKDFTSTVVLTNNNTFLLSNSSEEKSKRNRTVPRKFGDYVRTEVQQDIDEMDENDSSVRFNLGKKGHQAMMSRVLPPQIDSMRHVCVALTPIGKIVDYMETWCMIHELYRCFCNGESVTGKPFVLQKISDNCIALSEELVVKPSVYRASSQKAKYLFEPSATKNKDISFIGMNTVEKTITEPVPPKPESSVWKDDDPEEEMIDQYIRSLKKARKKIYKRGELGRHMLRGSSARCVAFDKSTQHALNKLNAPRVKKFISTMEKTPKILALLRKRYVESVCMSKKELLDQLLYQKTPIFREKTPERKMEDAAMDSIEMGTAEESQILTELDNVEQAQTTTAWKDNENMRNTDQPGFPVISSVTSLGAATRVVGEGSSSGTSTPRLSGQEEEIRKTLLDKLNVMVSRMMTTISKNEEKSYLDAPQVNKITTFRWLNLLKEYRSFRLHFWEVQYPKQNYLIITRNCKPPNMPEGYTEIVELRTSRNTPNTQFAYMITISDNVSSIGNLAALLFGHMEYWQVMGFMKKSGENQKDNIKFFSVSKETHPHVADKITKLYDILLEKVKAVTSVSSSPIKTNVKLMTKEEVKKASFLKFPLPSELGQRWFMLLITNDFSDISHPKWGQMLSYDRISYAISMSEINGRTVQVKSNNSMSLNPGVYVAPGQNDKIFIGPYDLNEECNIVLYQRLDGNILLREDYEKLTKVQRTNSTMGCWIQLKPGQRATPEMIRQVVISDPETSEVKDAPPQPAIEEKPDEDCVLVEADPKEIREAEDAHEAETAVNAILPGGLKLPTEEPKKLMANPVEKEVQVVPTENSQNVQEEEVQTLPTDKVRIQRLAEEALKTLKPTKYYTRKRKSSTEPLIEDLSKFKIKDLTIFPLSENEEVSDWDGSNSSSNLPSVTILPMETENSVEMVPDMSFPVISKVVSLGEAEKTGQVKKPQQSLLKSKQSLSQTPNVTQNDDSEDQKSTKQALTPFEQNFAEYLENTTDYTYPPFPRDFPFTPKKIHNRRKTICCTDSGIEKLIPISSAELTFDQPKSKKVEEMPKENDVKGNESIKIVSISCGPASSVETVVVRSEVARVIERSSPSPVKRTVCVSSSFENIPNQQNATKVAFTTSGKKVIIHPMKAGGGRISSPPPLIKRTSPPPLTKRIATPPLTTVVKKSRINEYGEWLEISGVPKKATTSTTTSSSTIQSSLTNLQENLMASLKSIPSCLTVGQTVLQKVCGTTSTVTASKTVGLTTTSTATTSTTTKTPIQIVNSLTLGQTILQKMPMKTSAGTEDVDSIGKNVTLATTSTTTSTTTKPIPIAVSNGIGNQMMKVRINFTPPGSTTSNTVILPKNAIMTTPKLTPIATPRVVTTAAAECVPGTSNTSPLIATNASSAKPPLLITHPDGNKTVTFTRTTADGKDIKYVLPLTKVSSSAIKLVPASQKTSLGVATVSQTPKKVTVPAKTVSLVQEASIPSSSTAVATTVQDPVPGGSKKLDVIELSDDEDSVGQKTVQNKPHYIPTSISAQILKDFMKPNEIVGFVVSNIPQLGYIQARLTDNMTYYYIELPTRKHPFKVGCNCLDRYLDRYMRYCVELFMPQDLIVKWEFIACEDKLKVPKEKFSLQASKNKEQLVLTKYGVMDMEDHIDQDVVKDPAIYMQLLLLHLSFTCLNGIKPAKGIDVVNLATDVIKDLKKSNSDLLKTSLDLRQKKRELRSMLLNRNFNSSTSPEERTQ